MCIIELDATDFSLLSLYSGAFIPNKISLIGRRKPLDPGPNLPQATLESLALAKARALGLPPNGRCLEKSISSTSIPGYGDRRSTFEAFFGVPPAGYPDHRNARPGVFISVDAATGTVMQVYNEWRYRRLASAVGARMQTATAAANAAVRVLPEGFKRKFGIRSPRDFAVSLMYVVPNGVNLSPSGPSPRITVSQQFPKTSILAYVMRGKNIEIWLDPVTLAMIGGVY